LATRLAAFAFGFAVFLIGFFVDGFDFGLVFALDFDAVFFTTSSLCETLRHVWYVFVVRQTQ
jgi:hypothetical protein